MEQAEILTFITEVQPEEIDLMDLAEAYAAIVDELQSSISERELRQLLLLGAAIFRSALKGTYTELQMPVQSGEDSPDIGDDGPFKGLLH